jgi:hypothetical protein
MCLFRCRNIRDFDPKTRQIWVCGNLSLYLALSMTLFAERWKALQPAVFDCLHGFLLGIAITFLICSCRRMRRSDNCA